ncbi:hypothetical protein Tco_1325580, partial [Tanacetum coccineum]
MKSARICPLTDILGLYYMSYSRSSIIHFCSLPATSVYLWTLQGATNEVNWHLLFPLSVINTALTASRVAA